MARIDMMWPREHGAYVQLLAPVLTGLILGRGELGAVAFTVAAASLFLSHEPLAIIYGLRGVRVRAALVGSARRRLWLLGGVASASVFAALVVAPWRAWAAAAIPLAPAAALAVLFLVGRIKSLAGETLVAAACAGMVLPLALSGGAAWGLAVVAAAVWFAAFLPSILAVHSVKAAHRGEPRRLWLIPLTTMSAALVVLAALTAPIWLPALPARAVAAVPPALVALGVALVRPHPRHLRRIGWSMAAAYVVTLLVLVVPMR